MTMETESSHSSLPQKKKLHRKSPKQASVARLELKEQKDEYTTRFKTAFKEATNLVAYGDLKPVDSMMSLISVVRMSSVALSIWTRLTTISLLQAIKEDPVLLLTTVHSTREVLCVVSSQQGM